MIKRLSIIVMALAIGAASWAIPAKRAWHTLTQPDGTQVTLQLVGDERAHHFLTTDGLIVLGDEQGYYYADVDARGDLIKSSLLAADPEARLQSVTVDQQAVRQAFTRRSAASPRRLPGLYDYADFPLTGEIKGVVILVEYQDVTFSISDEEAHEYFGNMLNQPGFSAEGATGSARDYYLDASMGVFQPTFDLYGPVTLPYNRSYYGGNDSWGNDKKPEMMVVDAINILKDEVDFSQYDLNGDGVVDNIFIYYAGVGEAQTYVSEAVWPHSWQLNAVYGGKGYKIETGLYANYYACSSELCDSHNTLDGIGTFVHEFSHVMGLPDLYNTEDVSYVTPCEYDVMDQGSYNNNSRTPPTYSIFERAAMGWLEPTPITESFTMTLGNIAETNEGYIIPTGKTNEFFLFENRQREGWDKYIPWHGMLVWHIDYSKNKWYQNAVNNDDNHQRVDLVEACGQTYATTVGMRKYPFPGTNKVKTFRADTNPALVDWAGNNLGVAFDNITETDGLITADVNVGTGAIADVAIDCGLVIDRRTITTVDGASITVTDLAGRTVASGSVATVAHPGLYIVTVNNRSVKVAIK